MCKTLDMSSKVILEDGDIAEAGKIGDWFKQRASIWLVDIWVCPKWWYPKMDEFIWKTL